MIGLSIAFVVIWVVALVDVLQRAEWDFPNGRAGAVDPNERLVWVLVVILASGIGAIVYYFVVMKPYPRRNR